MKRKLELLSPARDLTAGIEAVNCGADAVYIGTSKFGARSAAGNSIDDISLLVKHAHLFNASVYVTINTILYEEELEEVQNLINDLYQIGVDAIIIQDLGILKMKLPPIAIHASTQCHNYEIEKILLLESLGVTRVVLARELSLSQISEIRRKTSIELECFVHGSLCVSLSGQCYLSHFTHNRSANRGKCAQLCRLEYSLIDASGKVWMKNKHLLSLKDMNRIDYLDQLIELGVCSFKIEGRLKDVAYVKNVTTEYHKSLNKICIEKSLERTSQGECCAIIESNINKSFNRGYTDYFLSSNKRDITAFKTPKSLGICIGKVKKVIGDKLYLDTDVFVNNGDGLCFFDKNEKLTGIEVNGVKDGFVIMSSPQIIKPGTDIYRNKDKLFSAQLDRSADTKKLKLSVKIKRENNVVKILLNDMYGNNLNYQLEVNNEDPQNPIAFKMMFQKQFIKTGGTPYLISFIELDDLPFMPIGDINILRRTVLDLFTKIRMDAYKRPEAFILKNFKWNKNHINYQYNVSNSLSKKLYEDIGVTNVDWAVEKENNIKDVALMTAKHCLRYELGDCPKRDMQNTNVSYPLYLIQGRSRYRVCFDCKACEMKIFAE